MEEQEHISSSKYFSSSNTALIKFSKVQNTTRETGWRFVARRQKAALLAKWKDHILTILQIWETHFVFLSQLFLAMEDKFIQNSPFHQPQKSILTPPEGANFHLEVHDFYLKGNYWLFKVWQVVLPARNDQFELMHIHNKTIIVQQLPQKTNQKGNKTPIYEVFGHNPKFLHNALLILGAFHNMISYLA